jgi:L-alanine-DL-glutamate epimerase-like enolase superfamily enzyme
VKIISVESFVMRVPIRRPIGDATHDFEYWSAPGCWITTDEGLVGTGYTGLEGHGERLITEVIDRHYAPQLIGENPHDVVRHWERLQWGKMHWVGRAGVTQMALSAIDIALWDLKAQAAGVPLWRLLGGHKQTIPSYNTDGGWLNWSTEELVDDTARLIDEGWGGVKIKLGKTDLREDLARLSAVRERLGSGPMLMVDVNMAWDVPRARAAAAGLVANEVFWLEEPLYPDDVAGHAELARSIVTPIALGESLYHRFQFRDFLTAQAIGYVQADVTRVGGVTEWTRIASLAAAFNTPVVPHAGDMMQIHQHLVGATANAPMIEYIPWLLELFEEPVVVQHGTVLLPETPGASTAMRGDAIERWRVQ